MTKVFSIVLIYITLSFVSCMSDNKESEVKEENIELIKESSKEKPNLNDFSENQYFFEVDSFNNLNRFNFSLTKEIIKKEFEEALWKLEPLRNNFDTSKTDTLITIIEGESKFSFYNVYDGKIFLANFDIKDNDRLIYGSLKIGLKKAELKILFPAIDTSFNRIKIGQIGPDECIIEFENEQIQRISYEGYID